MLAGYVVAHAVHTYSDFFCINEIPSEKIDGNFINSTVGIPSSKKLSRRRKHWREAVTDSTLRTSATDAVGKWRKKFRKNRLAAVARKFSLGNGSKKEFPEFLPSLTDGIGRGRSQCGIRNGLPSIFPARAQLFHWRYAYGTINKITVAVPAVECARPVRTEALIFILININKQMVHPYIDSIMKIKRFSISLYSW